MLGTGNALVTECYNTCFVLEDGDQRLVVDGGGGSTVLHQLKHTGFDWMDMRRTFVTHEHVDHLLGIAWMVRMICQLMGHGDSQGWPRPAGVPQADPVHAEGPVLGRGGVALRA